MAQTGKSECMANVWKVGSRWCDYGAKHRSVISAFRRNNIVFIAGPRKERFLSVKAGDYLAITDGVHIVAVAKVIKDAEWLSKMPFNWSLNNREDEILGDFETSAIGVKVKIVDLKQDETIFYGRQGGKFCRILRQQVREKIIDRYEKHNKQFSIQSFTCTLLPKQGNENIKAIFDKKTKYIIPVYQRPYSWTEREIEPFINDIFKGFWGVEKKQTDKEPMFIGTMQLSEKKFIDANEYEQHIIDGQQRLTTLLILIKFLSLLFPENRGLKDILKSVQFETQVGEEQQQYFELSLKIDTIPEKENELNRYLNNMIIIKNLFMQNTDNDTDIISEFNIDDFLNYLTTEIYFVVIETYAGLSKTLQIFKAINTTGLDLNGGDIFKIRMHEYLTSEKHDDSRESFKKIKEIYNLLDEKNKETNSNITIREVLGIYQDYLIAQYELPNVLFDYGVDTFYDRLFDSLLNINQSEHFKRLKDKKVELKLDELTDIIQMRYEWNQEWKNAEYPENIISSQFVWWSRYRKDWKIIYTLLYVQRKSPNVERYKNCEKLLTALCKLFFIYSIRYDKIVKRIRTTFMQNLKKQVVKDSFENTLTSIERQITSENNKGVTKDTLNGYIADNPMKKNLICRLSAFLDEQDANVNVKEMENKLFGTHVDIEHIHANADTTVTINDVVLQNGIGNLVMLEYSINRSVQHKPFNEKKNEYKRSRYRSIEKIATQEKWTETEILERRENEVKRILKYLFGEEHTEIGEMTREGQANP